jgi:hypothetical protein
MDRLRRRLSESFEDLRIGIVVEMEGRWVPFLSTLLSASIVLSYVQVVSMIDGMMGLVRNDATKLLVMDTPAGTPPVPAPFRSGRFDISLEESDTTLRMRVTDDGVEAAISTGPPSARRSTHDDNVMGEVALQLLVEKERARREGFTRLVAGAVRTHWIRDQLKEAGIPDWVSAWPDFRVAGMSQATSDEAAKKEVDVAVDFLSTDAGKLARSLAMATRLAAAASMMALALSFGLSRGKSDGRLESLFTTRVGMGHLIAGRTAIVFAALVVATCLVMAWMIGLMRLLGYESTEVVPRIVGSICTAGTAVFLGSVFCMPMAWYATTRAGSLVRKTVMFAVTYSAMNIVLSAAALATALAGSLPFLAEVSTILSPDGIVSRSIVLLAGASSWFPVSGAMAWFAGRDASIPSVIFSAAAGVIAASLMYRPILRVGRTAMLPED